MVLLVCAMAASVLTLTGRLSDLLVSLRVAADATPAAIDNAVAREMELTRKTADRRIASIESRLDAQLTAARAEARLELEMLREVADRQLSDANHTLAGGVEEAVGIRQDIQPTVDAVNQLSPSIMRNTLGLIAAAKVTAGETAQAMRRVDAALPEAIQATQRIADNSDKTTAATAEAMRNVAEVTKPLPRWLRVPLQIIPGLWPIFVGIF